MTFCLRKKLIVKPLLYTFHYRLIDALYLGVCPKKVFMVFQTTFVKWGFTILELFHTEIKLSMDMLHFFKAFCLLEEKLFLNTL